MNNLAYQEYRGSEILSTGQEELLLKLYSVAINSVDHAIKCCDASDKIGKAKSIGKAVSITTELMNALDPEVDSELAANLERLYLFVNANLAAANAENNKSRLEVALQVLTQLHDGWKGAWEQLRAKSSTPEAGAARRVTTAGRLNADHETVGKSAGPNGKSNPVGYEGNISIIT